MCNCQEELKKLKRDIRNITIVLFLVFAIYAIGYSDLYRALNVNARLHIASHFYHSNNHAHLLFYTRALAKNGKADIDLLNRSTSTTLDQYGNALKEINDEVGE